MIGQFKTQENMIAGVKMEDGKKTKAQLLQDLESLREQVTELETAKTKLKVSENDLDQLRKELSERTKEMNCLYAISRLRDEPGISADKILQEIVRLIPPAWQFPEITRARLALQGGQVFESQGFMETPWRQEGKLRGDFIRPAHAVGRLAGLKHTDDTRPHVDFPRTKPVPQRPDRLQVNRFVTHGKLSA